MAAWLKSLQNLVSLLFVFLRCLVSAQEADHSLFNGFNGVNLTLNGAAKIHENGLLELTNTSKQQIGRAFFPLPLRFRFNESSFSTNFVFAMVPVLSTFGGHGIAFTFSPSVEFRGATATQCLGLFNSTTIGLSSNHVLAVELDTVLSPDFADINENHVGVDINNLTSVQSAPVTYFSESEGRNESLQLVSGDPIKVWIDYNEEEKLLNITPAPSRSRKPRQPLLSTPVNLSSVFMDSMYVGFSSSTGSVASHHYILGWSFNKSGEAQSLDISKLPSLPRERKSRQKLRLAITVPQIAGVILLVTISATVYIMRKRYEEVREDWEQQYGPQRFSYKDLQKATKGFKDKELLGCGGFGRVYRGVLPSSNLQVAVKKVSHDSKQGLKEFVAEIASMGRLRHRNLVQLLGYCRQNGELFLVYDYMPNGSLDKFLFSSEKPHLNWVRRYQILKGVGSALLYLHEEWVQVVLHRDVKASNVLLDADLNGRLGDFGLAKFHDHGSAPQTTCVVSTVGYLAPEITRTGHATTSTDVFAFGTFMLEVACGRKPVESNRPPEEVFLVDWIYESWKTGTILETCDLRLEGKYVVEEMELVLKLGLLCTHRTPSAKPSMRQIMQYLDKNDTLSDISLHGANIGLIPFSNEVTEECILPVPPCSDNFSLYSLSDGDSILSTGR